MDNEDHQISLAVSPRVANMEMVDPKFIICVVSSNLKNISMFSTLLLHINFSDEWRGFQMAIFVNRLARINPCEDNNYIIFPIHNLHPTKYIWVIRYNIYCTLPISTTTVNSRQNQKSYVSFVVCVRMVTVWCIMHIAFSNWVIVSIDMVVPDPDASSRFLALLYNNRKWIPLFSDVFRFLFSVLDFSLDSFYWFGE